MIADLPELRLARRIFRRGDPLPSDLAAFLTNEGVDLHALESSSRDQSSPHRDFLSTFDPS